MAKINILLKRLRGARVYFDVNPVIYFIEQNDDFFAPVAPIFHMLGEGSLMAFTSELSPTEILTKPIQDKRPKVIDTYKDCQCDGKPMQILHHQ